MQAKKFQRRTENFICENCGQEVVGDGYTDHCPNCLWGKHVDVNPGDRMSSCGGLMEPIGIELKAGKYIIEYKCKKCNYKFHVKSAGSDNVDKIIEISNGI